MKHKYDDTAFEFEISFPRYILFEILSFATFAILWVAGAFLIQRVLKIETYGWIMFNGWIITEGAWFCSKLVRKLK
jgi:hypothetical protein